MSSIDKSNHSFGFDNDENVMENTTMSKRPVTSNSVLV